MKAVILAAGKGTRMRPLSEKTPKPLLPVGNKPLIRHSVDRLLEKKKIEEVIVVGGYRFEQLEEEFKDEQDVRLVVQREQRGTAHAALQAKDFVDEESLILNGDDLYGDFSPVMKDVPSLLVSEVDDPENYGVVKAKDGNAKTLTEKPENPEGSLVNTGCFSVKQDFFDILEEVETSTRGELEITDALEYYIEERNMVVQKTELWQPCSYPWQLLKANKILLDEVKRDLNGRIHPSATVEGEVLVEEGAEIKEHTVLKGPAIVKQGAEIGPGSLLRPYSVVHEDVELRNSELKNSILMEQVKIPHFSYVGDSYLCKNVNLGAGTKTANLRHDGEDILVEINGELLSSGMEKIGAFIGQEAKIGVNCSIKPGRSIGSGAVIDAAEKIDRTVPQNGIMKDGEIVEDRD